LVVGLALGLGCRARRRDRWPAHLALGHPFATCLKYEPAW